MFTNNTINATLSTLIRKNNPEQPNNRNRTARSSRVKVKKRDPDLFAFQENEMPCHKKPQPPRARAPPKARAPTSMPSMPSLQSIFNRAHFSALIFLSIQSLPSTFFVSRHRRPKTTFQKNPTQVTQPFISKTLNVTRT